MPIPFYKNTESIVGKGFWEYFIAEINSKQNKKGYLPAANTLCKIAN